MENNEKIQLTIVNFEQAKALKKLGFPQECGNHGDNCMVYAPDGELAHYNFFTGIRHDEKSVENGYFAPQLELVANWMRKNKRKHIRINCEGIANYTVQVQYTNGRTDVDVPNKKYRGAVGRPGFEDYDIALSEGIDKVIEIESRVQECDENIEYED